MRIIPLLIAITALAEAVAEQPERSYKVEVVGGAGQVNVVAEEYQRRHGLSPRAQLGVLGADSEAQRILGHNIQEGPVKFTTIPGIEKGTSETVSNRTAHMGQKLRLSYNGELLGEIPGNPHYGATLSGFDHGHRGSTVSKAIVVSNQQLLLVVEQKGDGGSILDKVYRAMKGEDGKWSITEHEAMYSPPQRLLEVP